jgi:hypothetical protein
MLRPVITAAAILAPTLVSSLALAQEKPLSVFFRPCDVQQLNDAITAAMTSQGFIQVMKPGPDVLTVAIPDKVDAQKGRVSGTTWSFNVVFSRDGSTLGHAEESCTDSKIADCTDQLMNDIKSAAAAP